MRTIEAATEAKSKLCRLKVDASFWRILVYGEDGELIVQTLPLSLKPTGHSAFAIVQGDHYPSRSLTESLYYQRIQRRLQAYVFTEQFWT